MSLNERITAKLDAGIDADLFEQCAVALMADVYKIVVPIEGGSDGGRDGDIIAPFSDQPDSRGRILVTTGDLLDNLKSSHKTWNKFWEAGEAFPVDLLVMVTSKRLSNAKRRGVEDYCARNDLPVPHIYSQQWLVDTLRRNSDLRVQLTGIKGRLASLTTKAPEAALSSGLFGRDEELDQLRAAVMLTTDVSIVGVPGVGKSRLLAELEGSVHFADRLAREHLVDDLVTVEPRVVVVDDAHLNLELLEHLVRIRSMEGLRFTVVAATWPGSEDVVEDLLIDPMRVELEQLSRAALDQMIRTLGVHGVRARSYVLDQSDGRPGWAVMLSRLIVDGAGDDLATGQPLLDQAARLTAAIAGSAVLDDALACIAALGVASLEDLEVVSSVTGIAYADLIAWLETTAQGGLVDRTDDKWSVLAPLRVLIAAATFFGAKRRRSWDSFAAKFPRDERLDHAVLEVASKVPGTIARALADTWFADVVALELNEVPLALVRTYGGIDEVTADRAAVLARRVLDAPREPLVLHGGITYDPTGTAAEEILRTAFRRTCSREATQGLLNLALVDDRPRHQHPDHPMRVIEDVAHYLDPDGWPADSLRDQILAHTLEWFDENPDEARWRVFAEVAQHVFDPRVEGHWSEPSSYLNFTMSQGITTPKAMGSLLDLWAEIDSRVRGEASSKITHDAVRQLCEVFDSWSALAGGISNSGVTPSPEQIDGGVLGSELVLTTLEVLAERFPGVPIRVNRQLALLATWRGGPTTLMELPIDDDRVARFVGVRELDDDIDAWTIERNAHWTSLARELSELTAEEGVAEYQRLVIEASVLAGNHEGALFPVTLAEHVANPGTWLEAAIRMLAYPLVAPLVTKARTGQADIDGLITLALGVPVLRPGVLRAIMREEGELDELAYAVIADVTDDDVPLIDDLWIHESMTPMLREILTHPRPAVRALAAVAFGEGAQNRGPAVPDELRSIWRTALIGAVPEQLPQHSRWRLGRILKHAIATDPVLCAGWFIAHAETSQVTSRLRRSMETFPDVVRDLPRDQKRRIVTTLDAETLIRSGYAGDVLGADGQFASNLQAEGVVNGELLLRSMSGFRDHTVEALAPALLAAGVDPRRIVAESLGRRSWSGLESAAILNDLTFFTELENRRPELHEVCVIASNRLEAELIDARAKEKQDKRRGW